jgi:23S rRNA pseudouridine2605 synthase
MEMDKEEKKERIAKVISRHGICSRRDAEKKVADGKVIVNGEVVDTPVFFVKASDEISVDGKALKKVEKERLFLFHKPAGLITTEKDEKGRKTVFEALPKNLPRLVSVGRLDLNTEGLLLLTNNGNLSRYLELPKTQLKRVYRVRVHGEVKEERLARLRKGVTVKSVKYAPLTINLDSTKGLNSWLTVSLKEGKNREVRRLLEFAGLTVNRLIRVSYGPFNLGSMPKGDIVELPFEEIKSKLPGYFT